MTTAAALAVQGLRVLLDAERALAEALPEDPGAYRALLEHLRTLKRMDASTYFRARRQDIPTISRALALDDPGLLARLPLNGVAVSWLLRTRAWPRHHRLRALAAAVLKTRSQVLSDNAGLALAQARRFRNRGLAPEDLQQQGLAGLLQALDKVVLPDDPDRALGTWIATAQQRVLAALMRATSSTPVALSKKDQQRLYRARQLRARGQELPADLQDLQSQVVHVPIPVDDRGQALEVPAPAEDRPDQLLEEHQARQRMFQAIQELSVLERKLLRLRGINLQEQQGEPKS